MSRHSVGSPAAEAACDAHSKHSQQRQPGRGRDAHDAMLACTHAAQRSRWQLGAATNNAQLHVAATAATAAAAAAARTWFTAIAEPLVSTS